MADWTDRPADEPGVPNEPADYPPPVTEGVAEPPAPPAPRVFDESPQTPPAVVHTDRDVETPRRSGCGLLVLAAVVAFIVATFAGLAAGFVGARLGNLDIDQVVRRPSRISVIPSETDEPVIAASAVAVPSVVNIDVRGGTIEERSEELPEGHPDDVPMIGNGSGVVYKVEDGSTFIITNNHVVQQADTITVRDESGQTRRATLVGRDAETDIAVVKVNGELAAIEVADSSKLSVGQTVVAIGSPFGLDHSVTSGVVSALGRSLPDFPGSSQDVYPLVDVIQTDAAINPGNSGGALVDLKGRLIGINTAIYSESGASGGVGFAVPSNTAVRVADQIIAGKEITHPFIGVIGTTVSPELAREENLSVEEGAYVNEVMKDSGAAKAGVKAGDVVVSVDGQATRSMDDLILQIRRKKVGDTVTLKLRRGESTLEVEAVVGDKPAEIDSREDTGTR